MELARVLLSSRPWSFIMTFWVGVSATLLAVYYGYNVNPLLSLLALIGAVMLHAFVNWFNDYGDFIRGVDRKGAGTVIYRPHLLYEGYMSTRQFLVLSFTPAVLALLIVFHIAFNGRPLVIPIGIAGLIIGFLYSYPPRLALKYNALGELAVFIAFGPLMFIGFFYTTAGHMDLRALIASVPLGLLIVSVLVANNIRDIERDRETGIKTLPGLLGFRKATVFFAILMIGAILYTVVEALVGVLPLTSLITLLSLPPIIDLTRTAIKGDIPADFDPRTSKAVTLYSLLLLVSLLIAYFIA